MFYGKVYPFSGDKENQNPKRVKTVSKTAAKSAGQCFIHKLGVHVYMYVCHIYMYMYMCISSLYTRKT